MFVCQSNLKSSVLQTTTNIVIIIRIKAIERSSACSRHSVQLRLVFFQRLLEMVSFVSFFFANESFFAVTPPPVCPTIRVSFHNHMARHITRRFAIAPVAYVFQFLAISPLHAGGVEVCAQKVRITLLTTFSTK